MKEVLRHCFDMVRASLQGRMEGFETLNMLQYIVDEMTVYVANSERGVVLDPLWVNSVVFYARPYN